MMTNSCDGKDQYNTFAISIESDQQTQLIKLYLTANIHVDRYD